MEKLHVKDCVLAKDGTDDEWYKAKVLKVDQDRYYVHYMGYNASHDKWVKATEVKKYLFVSIQHTVSLFKNKMVSWA